MTTWQQNQPIATIPVPGDDTLAVYVARWPGMPPWEGGPWEHGPRPPAVMWHWQGDYRYLPPAVARQFAAVLLHAADAAAESGMTRDDATARLAHTEAAEAAEVATMPEDAG